MRNPHRTPQPPLFNITRPSTHRWTWKVTYDVASSGYPTACMVVAESGPPDDVLIGKASCQVHREDDLRAVIEFLALEAMLAACQPELDGSVSHRHVLYERETGR